MKVLLLALWSSRKEIGLMMFLLAINSLLLGPVVFYLDTVESFLTNSTDPIIYSVPTSTYDATA